MAARVSALCLAALLGGLLCVGIQEMPLHGHHGWSLARRGVAARNTLRHGLVATRFAPVETMGDVPGATLVWYANHPALTSLLCAGAVAIFGEHPWAERLVPIAFSIVGLVLLIGLCRRARGNAFAAVVGLAALTMPLWTYYGSFVNHEPIVLCATIALVASMLAMRDGRRGATAGVVAAALLGTLDDWSFSFVLAPCVLWALWDGRKRGHAWDAMWIAVPAALGLAVVAAHSLSLPDESVELFRERFYGRSTLNLGFFEVVRNPLVAPRWPLLLGPIGGLATLAWPALYLWRRRHCRADALDGAMSAVWLGALAYCVVLSEGLRNHDYWIFLFAPVAPVALATMVAEAPVRARSITTAAVVAISLAVGLLAWHDFRRLPSELEQEWPSFRFEENQVMRHIHRRTAPDESVLVEETVEMLHQSRYFLDRPWGWFRGQVGLGDWAVGEGAAMLLVPASIAEGDALAELGSRFGLTAFGDHYVVDLRRGPGAVDARRLVFTPPSRLWRILRSLVYDPYRIEVDDARTRGLSRALWTRLGRTGPRTPPRQQSDRPPRRDLEALVARANDGDAQAMRAALPVAAATRGAVADLVGARLDRRHDGSVDVWVVARAHGAAAWTRPLVVWVSDMPEPAADWALTPRTPSAWWRSGDYVAFHRVVGLRPGAHDLWLRRQDDDALGLTADLELGTVNGDGHIPWVGRY